MKLNQKVVSMGAVGTLIVTLLVFQNVVNITPRYEEAYVPGSGIPLSEIVNSTSLIRNAVPGRIEIRTNEVAYLDQSVEVDELVINGQLHCDPSLADADIVLKARVIYVNGVFQCGKQFDRYLNNLTISLKPGNVDPKTSVAYRGVVVNNGGKMILSGNPRNANWIRLNETAEPGQNYIIVDRSVATTKNTWQSGDEVVIGPTSYLSTEGEKFTITSVEGNRVNLSGNIAYRHWGQTQTLNTSNNGTVVLDQRAEVANLSRNILIQADESAGVISTTSAVGSELGGHVMVMPGGKAYVDSVEFYKMGQAGIMARYPFHWHIVGNAPGQFIRNSAIHKSFQRCITIHRTNQTLVHNNVCYDFKGHGYFLEDGHEVDNTLSKNLGIGSKFPHTSKVLLASDKQYAGETSGRFPNVSVFWISHPRNTIIDNVASGSVGVGLWMAFENDIHDFQGNVVGHPILEDITLFRGNTAHSSLVGFTWDGAPSGPLTGNPNNPNDHALDFVYYKPPHIPTYSNLTSYKNKHTGFYYRGYTALFERALSADNGWHYWLSFNEVVRNSVMVGKSDNFSDADYQKFFSGTYLGSRIQQAGIIQYDGPFELDRVDFINYPTQKLYRPNTTTEVTPVPIMVTGGTERLTNTSRLVSFSPEPIHRMFMKNGDTTASLGILGVSNVRDHDGTLTGIPGGIVVGTSSMAVLPSSGCVDGGNRFYSHKICPATHKESILHFFNGDGNTGPWNQPFVVRRSDGMISDPMSQWDRVLGQHGLTKGGGNKVTIAENSSVDYEVMFHNLQNPLVWVNSETINPVAPVIRMKAQGKNCFLTGAPSVNSLEALKASSVSAYYSTENELFYRLIPNAYFYWFIPNSGVGTAHRYSSGHHNIQCAGPANKRITGYVDSVRRVSTSSTANVLVKGWACDFSVDQQIQVKFYAGSSTGLNTTRASLLGTTTANKESEAAVAFACGVPNTTPFRYEFTITAAQAERFLGMPVYAYGQSTSAGANLALTRSGEHVIPRAFNNSQVIGPGAPSLGVLEPIRKK